MEFLIAAGGATLFVLGLVVWSRYADKRDKERDKHTAQHAHDAQR